MGGFLVEICCVLRFLFLIGSFVISTARTLLVPAAECGLEHFLASVAKIVGKVVEVDWRLGLFARGEGLCEFGDLASNETQIVGQHLFESTHGVGFGEGRCEVQEWQRANAAIVRGENHRRKDGTRQLGHRKTNGERGGVKQTGRQRSLVVTTGTVRRQQSNPFIQLCDQRGEITQQRRPIDLRQGVDGPAHQVEPSIQSSQHFSNVVNSKARIQGVGRIHAQARAHHVFVLSDPHQVVF
eukprot:Lithocolla_globosa_v1_NODE_3_length_14236_cov_22.745998.p8 type:complete len:240 gc:universal NODE_3_length_14236_cov_22.745998:4109-4828(+)